MMKIGAFILAVCLAASTAAGQSAVRDLPPVYGGGVTSFSVSIAINPPPGVAVVGLEDKPPAGWPVSNISNGGALDTQSGKVKWGPFFGTIPASVSYELEVPGSASGPACFVGAVSFDGLDQPIGGDACVYGPIPAASEWGLLVLGLSILIGGTILLQGRDHSAQEITQ